MNTVVLGNKNLAVSGLSALERHGFRILAVGLNPDDDGQESDHWYLSLRKAAQERGITIIEGNVSKGSALRRLVNFAPDFLFSFSYKWIVRPSALTCAKRGAFNIHFGRLPFYRGCLPIVWAMAENEPTIGVTLHEMDAGIDTGPIVNQRLTSLSDNDTAFTVYFRCLDLAKDILEESLPGILRGDYPQIPQNPQEGSYHRQEYPHDRWISPSFSKARISCFIRAHTWPGYPTARVLLDGQEYPVLFADGNYSIPELNFGKLTLEELLRELNSRNWQEPK